MWAILVVFYDFPLVKIDKRLRLFDMEGFFKDLLD